MPVKCRTVAQGPVVREPAAEFRVCLVLSPLLLSCKLVAQHSTHDGVTPLAGTRIVNAVLGRCEAQWASDFFLRTYTNTKKDALQRNAAQKHKDIEPSQAAVSPLPDDGRPGSASSQTVVTAATSDALRTGPVPTLIGTNPGPSIPIMRKVRTDGAGSLPPAKRPKNNGKKTTANAPLSQNQSEHEHAKELEALKEALRLSVSALENAELRILRDLPNNVNNVDSGASPVMQSPAPSGQPLTPEPTPIRQKPVGKKRQVKAPKSRSAASRVVPEDASEQNSHSQSGRALTKSVASQQADQEREDSRQASLDKSARAAAMNQVRDCRKKPLRS